MNAMLLGYMIKMLTMMPDPSARFESLDIERRGPTLVVTLSRPESLNSLDVGLMSSLRSLWRDEDALRGTRCIIVTGSGKGFCAGADMSLLESDRADAGATAADELSFLPGPSVDVPVIAAVNGVCAGGGLHFVADAD